MTDRARLPNRRGSEVETFAQDGLRGGNEPLNSTCLAFYCKPLADELPNFFNS